MLEQVLASIDSGRERSIEGLKEFLRIASVSTKPEHGPDMQRAAELLVREFESAGLWARIEPTGGHPLVLAGTQRKPDRPTVLIYGHYDVQPPEPLEQWASPPFEPTIRLDSTGHEAIFARGAVDDKGQVWCHVQAIAAWAKHGELPVNLVLMIEGEEEIGSEHLEAWVSAHKEELRADVAVISDTGQFARDVPAITYGLRGLLYTEITVEGPSHDLHSGIYGGAVPNPANVLADLLAGLHNLDGKVNIPGFYDEVVELTPAERAMWAGLPFDERGFLQEAGVGGPMGETGFTTLERRWARPTCDINGLSGGYQGPGAKTIIPARASAKVSMRLVPGQDGKKIYDSLVRALRERAPKSVRVDVHFHSAANAALVPIDSAPTQLAARAVQKGFGKTPVMMREGGTVPIVGLLKRELGLDTLLVGFGLPDDRVHSPNEKFDLDALHRGTRTCAILYEELRAVRVGGWGLGARG